MRQKGVARAGRNPYLVPMNTGYDALALFSGGLDSILAAKVIMEQGLRVKCLHFLSPFFGKPGLLDSWREMHGLDIDAVDISAEFCSILVQGPGHGFGKVLNPCVDCKILMLSRARELMPAYGASFLVSGEVVGQRPMSQRRDVLNTIRNKAGVKDILLRPLSAGTLDPTPMEESGLVDRSRLPALSGRGRTGQMALAEHFKLAEIPTPSGGCMLAEKESAKRFWPVLKYSPAPLPGDFELANVGRQYWSSEEAGEGGHWLSIGRDRSDNQRLQNLLGPRDLLFRMVGFPGPIVVGRQFEGRLWSLEAIRDAAAFAASYSPKAVRSGLPVDVSVSLGAESGVLRVMPARETALSWREPSWEVVREEKKAGERQARGEE